MPAWGKAGYSLVEILVALAVFSLSAPGITVGVSLAVHASQTSAHFTLATVLAQDKLEELRAQLGARSNGSDSPRSGFDRQWSVAADSPETGVVRIDVAVSWTDYQPHSLTLATVVNE